MKVDLTTLLMGRGRRDGKLHSRDRSCVEQVLAASKLLPPKRLPQRATN